MIFRNRNVFKISKTDNKEGFLADKIKAGNNCDIAIENDGEGEQLVISCGAFFGKKVRLMSESGAIDNDEYLVLIDASKNHVVATLPCAKKYRGQLHLVCVDASHGIEIQANQYNSIFDDSNLCFSAKGDSYTLVCDQGKLNPGSWYCVGRYCSQWYA